MWRLVPPRKTGRSASPGAAALLLAAFVFLWHATLAIAAEPDNALQLRAVPDQMTLQPGASRQQLVIIGQRASTDAIANATLNILAGAGLQVDIKSRPTLPAASDLAWIVEIVADERTAKESVVVFRVDYQFEAKAGISASGIAAATAKVAYSALSVAQAVKATIHHGFETLQAGRSAIMYLSIENAGLEDVTLDQIALDGVTLGQFPTAPPKSLSENITSIEPVQLPVTIRGRDTGWIRIGIKVSDYVVPSARPLPLELTFSRGQGTQRQTGALAVMDKVTFGIAGLSDINTALQIPSVFILPGLLVVATWGIIWAWRRRTPAEPDSFPLSARGLEFYVVAITISLVTAYIYPRLTGRNSEMLERISLVDIGWIWFGSIFFVAPLTYAIGVFVSWRRRLSKEKKEARRLADLAAAKASANPQADDDPLETIEKMARLRQTLIAEAFQVTTKGRSDIFFKLGFGGAPDTDPAWTAPEILITITDDADNFSGQVDDAIENDKAAALVALLDSRKDSCKIGWAPTAGGVGPREIAGADLNDPQGPRSIVRRA